MRAALPPRRAAWPAHHGERRRAQACAKAFRSAFKGAYSKAGGWAWLDYRADQRQYAEVRALWLTEAPGKEWDAGRRLMRCATLQSMDSAFNSMQEQVRAVGRPGFRLGMAA